MKNSQQDEKLQAIHKFLDGLTKDDVEKMPFAEDVVLASPLLDQWLLRHSLLQLASCARFSSCARRLSLGPR